MKLYEMVEKTQYATDKQSRHRYLEFYEMLLRDYDGISAGSFLEIGVHKGGSLRLFRDRFPNFMIYGLDIRPKCMFEEERIKTMVVDATVQKEVNEKLENLQFDIILDDGSHAPSDQIAGFKNLFGRLKSNGTYIIEDLNPKECSVMPDGSIIKGMDVVTIIGDIIKSSRFKILFTAYVDCVGGRAADSKILIVRKV